MEIMQLLNILLFGLFFGLLTFHFAKKKHRNRFAWFFIGFSIGLIGLILILFLPSLQKQGDPKTQKNPPPIPKTSDSWIKLWYYLDPEHQQQGPIEFPDLIKKWREKGISEKSYIWGEGMIEWKPLSELPDLLSEFEQAR